MTTQPFPPHRLAELERALDGAAPVAEVHSDVRAALNAGRALLAEVRRLNEEVERLTGERAAVRTARRGPNAWPGPLVVVPVLPRTNRTRLP